MDNITYCQYQKIIRRSVWKQFKKEHPLFDLIIPIIVGLLIGILQSLYFTRSIEPILVTSGAAVVTVFIYIVLYLYYFSKEQVFVYNTNVEEVNRLGKMINPDVRFGLSEYRPNVRKPGDSRMVGVTIENLGVNEIKDCIVNLDSIELESYGTSHLPMTLHWSNDNSPASNGRLDIKPGQKVHLDIAYSKADYHSGEIKFASRKHLIAFMPGGYSTMFSIYGNSESNSYSKQRYSAKIVLEEGKDIRIENINTMPELGQQESTAGK
jgi:hypothetical protein